MAIMFPTMTLGVLRRTAAALTLAAVVVSIAGCDDEFLTETPRDFVGPGNFYRTEGDALAALSAVYAAFINGTGDNYYGRNFPMLVEYPTEMVTSGRFSATNERSLPDNFGYTPDHAYIQGVWASAYQAINRANAVIGNVPKIDMNVTRRDRIVGEAKFLRALHYFNLVRLFGGVPLRLTETASLQNLQMPRATAAEVYEQIIKDLTDAIVALPPASTYTGGDIGRASRGAAKTLLGKVYLQRGGTGVGPAADFTSAATVLRDVVASQEYRLEVDYNTLFDVYGGRLRENNAEVIFDIQNTRAPGLGGRLSQHVAPLNSGLGATGQTSITSELSFFNSYAATDTRRSGAWLLSYVKNGTTVTWSQTNFTAYIAQTPFPKKHLDHLMTGTGVEEPNFIILRYADVLLMLAEAVNEVSGPTQEARDALNAVRTRAALGNVPTTLTAAEFKDAVFQERRWELVMEGHGWFDTQRHWEWATARIEANLAQGRLSGAGQRYPKPHANTPTDLDKAKWMFFPIPQRAIDLNPSLEQNPGWGPPAGSP
jgi:starch-binding outer membrane protein, SusD/RagB family